jgi:hypothetical protein
MVSCSPRSARTVIRRRSSTLLQRADRFPARWRSNNQHAHCHPRFTPDREASSESSGGGGKAVLYTSDLTGYSNMYLVEVGEFDKLPDLG